MADGMHASSMRRIWTIAFREFRHTVITKGFIFGALVMPVVMFAAIAAIGLLIGMQMTPVVGTLVVIDESGTVAGFAAEELTPEQVAKDMQEALKRNSALKGWPGSDVTQQATASLPSIDVKVESVQDATRVDELRAKVQDGSLLGLAIVPPELLNANPKDAEGKDLTYTLIVPTRSAPRLTGMLEKSIAKGIVKARVQRVGTDYTSLKALLTLPETSVRRMSIEGAEADENAIAKMLLPMGFMMLLWVATFASGQYLLTTTIEEKASKVMEVLLSAVSPMELLCGKIIGYAMVSAVMLGMYGALGIAGLSAAAMGDLVSPGMLILMLVYFVMAYAFVSTMMASVGSAVNDLREAQSLVTPAMLILMLPIMLWLPISEQPNGWIATISSFIPPAIPFVMVLRVTASNEQIDTWQVVLSLVWGFAWVGAFIWGGAKIFRVGVLMQGKPPSPRELLKWIRMA
jgi:ABC-2 type transport system permease protein